MERMSREQNTRTGIFHILDLSCAKCTRNIENSIRSLEGVSKASVSYLTDEAIVEYDSRKASSREILKAIKRMGYRAFETKERLI